MYRILLMQNLVGMLAGSYLLIGGLTLPLWWANSESMVGPWKALVTMMGLSPLGVCVQGSAGKVAKLAGLISTISIASSIFFSMLSKEGGVSSETQTVIFIVLSVLGGIYASCLPVLSSFLCKWIVNALRG